LHLRYSRVYSIGQIASVFDLSNCV